MNYWENGPVSAAPVLCGIGRCILCMADGEGKSSEPCEGKKATRGGRGRNV